MNKYDSTQLKTYMQCPYKYYLKFIGGLVPREKKEGYDLTFGQKVHTALETWYRYLKDPVNSPKLDLDELFKDYEYPEAELSKTPEGGVKLLREYHSQWKSNDESFKVLDVEQIRELDIDGRPFIVKLDTEVEQNENKYSLEHKTASDISYDYFEKFNMDLQISAQAYAIRELYGQCSGVIINAMAVKFYKRKTDEREKGLNCTFKRSVISKNHIQLNDFKLQASSIIDRIEKDRESNFFPRHLHSLACNAYRGHCPYTAICQTSAGMEVDEEIVDVLYELVDPLEYLKKEGINENNS